MFFAFPFPVFAFAVEGRVSLEPPLPEPVVLEVPKEHVSECGDKKISPKLEISPEGFVANAIVQLEGTFPALENSSAKSYTLDQRGCEFRPHVLLLPQNAELRITNSEAMLHNVRAFNEQAVMLFNDAMPRKGQVLKKRFAEPGRLVVRCGVHKWMHALVVITDHPHYALTDEKGYFRLEGIPEGTYSLKVWHESLGELEASVDSKTPPLTLTYPKR